MGSVYLRIISFLFNIKIEINIEYSSSTSGRSEMPLYSSPKNIIRVLRYYGFLTCLFLLHLISFSSSNSHIKEWLATNRTEAELTEPFLCVGLNSANLPVYLININLLRACTDN